MLRKDDEKYAKANAKITKRVQLFLRASAVVAILVFTFRLGSVYYASRADFSDSKGLRHSNGLKEIKKPDVPMLPTLEELDQKVAELDSKVREIRKRVDIFETDKEGQAAAKELQAATRQVLHRRFGTKEPYRVVVELEFQRSIKDFAENGSHGSFTIELARSALQPHSIHTFLEIARQWHGGAFHRIANHVLQVMVETHTIRHLAFQEYSPAYPHKERTVGYAGRPSGPAWYVSIEDNSKNHGPGSQQDHNPFEADSCFGTVIEGYDQHVLRIRKVEGMGFLGDAKKHVLIKSMTIQVPGESGNYELWHDPSTASNQISM